MGRTFRKSLAAAACVVSVVGCSTPYRSVVADVDAGMWDEPVELILPNADTLDDFDWQLFIRSDERIAADTFTLRIAVETPDSLRFEEPFLVRLSGASAPAARLRESLVGYRRSVRLARTGDYRLTIRPTRPLRGVEAVGIQTVKSN